MATVKSFEKDGRERGTMELPDNLFGCEVNEYVMQEAVCAYLANQRLGTASTKGRSEVAGGGRKPFRQKGTGRARAGTIRSPIWRGGGVVFGPRPRDYRIDLPKKVKRLALRSALTSRTKEGDIVVVEDLDYSEPKTRTFVELLQNLGSYGKKVLLVLDEASEAVIKSARNVAGVRVTLINLVNTYEVLWADKIIITERAVRKIEEVSRA